MNNRAREELFLIDRVYKDFKTIFPEGGSIGEITNKLLEGELLLEFSKKDGSTVIDQNSINEIKKVIPCIQRIIEKPRSFIKSIEEKVPIETAKRINRQAITRLSRDSNDWYARTFLTVIPKNVISDLNEETINLYENRFIKTLIDRILTCVSEKRSQLENIIDKIDSSDIDVEKNRYFNDFHRFDSNDKLLRELSKNDENMLSQGIWQQLNEELEDVLELERKIINIKYSSFYQTLRGCRKVSDPIERTNILMFDQNYNKCYKLWNYLNKNIEEQVITYDDTNDVFKPYVEEFYFAYLVFNVIGAMANNDYRIKNNPVLKFDSNYRLVSLNGDIEWKKESDLIKVTIDTKSHKLIISYIYGSKPNDNDTFELYSNYQDFEGKSRNEVGNITDNMIDKLINRDKKSKLTGKYTSVSFDINECSINNDYGEQLYRRFFNIGDNYAETEKDITHKGNYKTGIIMVTPLDVRYNILHIERLINSHILRHRSLNDHRACPLCGSGHIKVKGKDIECYDCHHLISLSSCKKCGNNEIVWVKYNADIPLSEEFISKILEGKAYYFQLRKYEIIMGQYAISSFRFEKETTGWKLKSICPKCGVLLGDVNK